MADRLRKLADYRRQKPPCSQVDTPGARKTLEQTICRCLAAYPDERFNSGAELAEQLEGCRQLRQAERALPPATGIVPSIIARPFLWFVLLVLLPQIVASAINISYNASQIAGHLTAPQQQMFMQLVTIYNLAIYPVAFGLFVWAYVPVRRTWREMHGHAPLAPGRVAGARKPGAAAAALGRRAHGRRLVARWLTLSGR